MRSDDKNANLFHHYFFSQLKQALTIISLRFFCCISIPSSMNFVIDVLNTLAKTST